LGARVYGKPIPDGRQRAAQIAAASNTLQIPDQTSTNLVLVCSTHWFIRLQHFAGFDAEERVR
jgi:hypothetical protein